MSPIPPDCDQDTYDLALITPDTRKCLVVNDKGDLRLPRLMIPKQTRPAQEISRLAQDRWGINLVVLDVIDSVSHAPGCVIGELFWSKPEDVAGPDVAWSPITALHGDELNVPAKNVLNDLLTFGSTKRGAFSRLGWINDAITWLVSELSDREFHFSGNFEQLNADASFALIRFGNTRGPAYWIKAVGDPNLHELQVTETLARLFPQYVPTVVGSRLDWHAWIMKDAGKRLTEPLVRHELESLTLTLAELQKAAVEHQQVLLTSGCFDQRLKMFRTHIPQMVDYLVRAMSMQTSRNAPKVPESRLREIGDTLTDACTQMDALNLPTSIIHNDFSFGNVLFDGSRCVLIDWAEAGIGVPTITYQHLRHYISRETEASAWLPLLDTIYKRAWSDVLTDFQIDRALALSPLLALGSHLLGRSSWLYSSAAEAPAVQKYARGLARHMDRAASELISRQVLSI